MTQRLRFLHVTTFYAPYNFGGDGIFVSRLVHALAEAGHLVDIVHCVDAYGLLSRRRHGVEMPAHPNINVFGLRSGFGWLSPLLTQQTGYPLFKRGEIDRLLKGRYYDIVHYHNISLFGPGILSWTPPSGAALKIYTMHEHWLVCPTHVLWKFNQRPCERPQCFLCQLRAGRPPQLWRFTALLERAAREVDQFLSPSAFTARMHNERGFRNPVAILPPFAEHRENDRQADRSEINSQPYFLFVGRLEKSKGAQVLVELWKRIAFADLFVAGDGRNAAEFRAHAAGNSRIRFLGELGQDQLENYYSNSLACIVPSLTYETSSLVMIEAFAANTPVIAHDLGALSEMIAESGGGLLYRNGDELLQAVHRIAESAPLRAELARKGCEYAAGRWSKEAHLGRYFELIGEAYQRKFGSPRHAATAES